MQQSDGKIKQAAAYLRVSTDLQPQSIETQRAALKRYCKENGFEIIKEYVDDAVSGTSVRGRKDFLQMIEDVEMRNNTFRYILVYDVSRFSRGDPDEVGHYRFLLRQHGVEIIYTAEDFRGDDTDYFMRSYKQVQVRGESKDTSRKTIDGQVAAVRNGLWMGGVPPYGYDLEYLDTTDKPYMTVRFLETGEKQIFDGHGKVLRIVPPRGRVSKTKKDRVRLTTGSPERVSLVKRIFHMYLRQDLGYKAIAARLNSEGIPSPRNGTWSKSTGVGWSLATIRSILMNPLYTGDMVWNRRASGKFHRIAGGRAEERKGIHTNELLWNDESDWEIIHDAHPAIISQKTFDEVQRLRLERSVKRDGAPYRSGRAKNSVYLLRGILVCSHCGHHFHGHTVASSKHRKNGERIKTRYYACGGAVSKGKALCRLRLLRKEELEADILNRIKHRVDGFLCDGADVLLRKFLERELKIDFRDPKEEIITVRKKIGDIDNTIDRLLESLTPINKEYVDRKLIGLKREHDRLERELEALETLPSQIVDISAVADEIIESMSPFEDIFKEGTLEEQKEFIRLFVQRIEIDAEEKRAWVYIRRFPTGIWSPGILLLKW